MKQLESEDMGGCVMISEFDQNLTVFENLTNAFDGFKVIESATPLQIAETTKAG